MALAALLYIYRVSETTTVSAVTPKYIDEGRPHILQDKSVPDYVSILRIHGPFLFGTTDKLAEQTADLSHCAPVVILRLRNMTAIDATGLHALEVLCDRLRRSGRSLILCGACDQPRRIMNQEEFIGHIGAKNLAANVQDALQRAQEIHAGFSGLGEEVALDLEHAAL
jgi:SulP family sulfate permease